MVIENSSRLLSTDTIKDESLWEAESALAQLWEHEDRVVSSACVEEEQFGELTFVGRITRREPCVDLDPGDLKIFPPKLILSRRR